MQFKVPQNIDMEDRIVGPLTLIQFLYLLGGGLIVYGLLETFRNYLLIFYVLSIPVILLSLGLAFIKIQDQPLLYFIKAGLVYLSRPKQKVWQRQTQATQIIDAAPEVKKANILAPKKQIKKSELDQLAYLLDTKPFERQEEKKLGQVSQIYEKLIKEDKAFQAQGGVVGSNR